MEYLKKYISAFLVISLFIKTESQKYTPKKIDSLITLTFQLTDRKEALKISNNTYKLSEEIGYYNGKAKSLKAKINTYLGLGEQGKALITADKLYDLSKKENDYYHITQALIARTISYAYLGFFDKATKTSLESEEICGKIKDNDDFYSSLGQIYAIKAEINNLQYQTFQTTLKYDLKSVEYYKKIKDTKKRNGWLAIQYSSLGYTYIDMGDYKPAILYNRKAYELARLENDSINQAFGLYGLGNAYMEMNEQDSSVYYYKKSLPVFEKANDIYRLQYIYDDLASIYEKKGDNNNYSYYAKKSRELAEVIRKKERVETDSAYNTIIEDEKKNWYQNFYLIIGSVILLAFILFLISIKFFKNYKEEKGQKKDAEHHLIEKEEELNHLESKINDSFTDLLELAKNNNSSFLTRFKEVYPVFYNKLITNYPELTTGQLQFCALLKLNFTTKEIAHYNNISVRSVETRKNRLRKQLNISSEIDLNKWMMEF